MALGSNVASAKLSLEIIFALDGILFIAVGWSLAKRKVAPNGICGVRTRLTLSNEDRWYRVNETFGYGQAASGVVILATAIGFSRLAFLTYAGILGIGIVTSILVSYALAVNKERRRP